VESQLNDPYGGGSVVALADLDGDGTLDIIVLSYDMVSVLLGTGNGGFAPVAIYNVPSTFSPALGVADLNGDGSLDILNSSGSVLFNNGDGTFAPAINNNWGDSTALALGDFDGDGFTDVVVSGYTTTLAVLFNTGNGVFLPPIFYNVGTGALVPVDLNGDGKLDLVSSDGGVLFNNGNGTFAAVIKNSWGYSPYYLGAGTLVMGDLDGDGVPDAVLPRAGSVVVALGQSNGVSSALFSYPVGSSVEFSGAVADLNADGKLDIVVTNRDTNTVSVLLNGGCLP
jgi:hypothetical protein